MGFFDFLKKKKAKTYNVSPDEFKDAVLICQIVKAELAHLDYIDPKELNIIEPGTKDRINYRLCGYIAGLYNAHAKYFEKPFNHEALELVVSTLFGEAAGNIFTKELMIATLATQSRENIGPFSKIFELFIEAQKMGWNEYMNWRNQKCSITNGLYKLILNSKQKPLK